jgi:O-antigen/teichoic acid export membrane protein
MATMPLLTRLYAPEDFGALAVFAALHAILAGLFTLKYDLSIILPAGDDKALDLTLLTVTLSALLSSLLFAGVAVGHLAFGALPPYYLLLPLSTLLAAGYTCGQQWGARKGDYGRFARSQVVNATANVATGVMLAIAASLVLGNLVAAFVTGLGAGLAYLMYDSWRNRAELKLADRFARLVATAREYRRFPLYVLPSSLMMTLGISGPPFVLQALFSLQEVGHYAIASRFLLIPGALVGGAVSEAFRPELVDRINRGEQVSSFVLRTTWRLMLVAIPFFALFFLIAPMLFSFLFGEDYRLSGILSRYLALGVLAQFIAQPLGYVFVATHNVRLGLFLQSTLTMLSLIGLVVGGLYGGLEEALLLSSFLTFAVASVLVLLAQRCCRAIDRALPSRHADA